MKLKSLRSAPVNGKRVLLRTDFNVPIQNGKIQDTTRLKEALPTLLYLKKRGAKTIIITHLGRPKGKVDPKYKVDLLARAISKLLGQEVLKLKDCVGKEVEKSIQKMKAGDFILLENVRFHPEEEKNQAKFARALTRLADLYVNDAFGTLHRAHASTEGVTHFLPSFAGLLVEKEVKALERVLKKQAHPLCLIVGGAKIDTKIGILERFLDLADSFLIGGALANTFLKAQGWELGTSLYEKDKVKVAREFLKRAQGKTVLLPVDVVRKDLKILDIGPQTTASFISAISKSKTVIWNGPMGLYELRPFEKGTRAIAKALTRFKGQSILGGGDTVDAIHRFGFSNEQFTHISTGGGAMLEFLEGKALPGLRALYR